MTLVKKLVVPTLILVVLLVGAVTAVQANDLTINNVTLEERLPAVQTVVVEFDLSWDNAWRTKFNHDAVWLTFRLHNPAQTPSDKKLCELSLAGVNPSGFSVGSNSSIEFNIPSDKKGAFAYLNVYGPNTNVTSTDMRVVLDYASCGFADTDNVYASVTGIEMVYVSQGAFYVGDYSTSTAALDQGSSDTNPWYISSEEAISISNQSTNGYRYVSAGNSNENATGSSFTLSADFPKGYTNFYAMKYEITEGLWVDFINSLGSAGARARHDLTDNLHKNTDSVLSRNTISCSGAPLICSSQRPQRAVSYLTWMDVAAFLDWAALRPMTELEFEKMGRGPLLAVAGEMAWGSSTLHAATTISAGNEEGLEVITNSGANVHYNNTILTGGDSSLGVQYQSGPLRGGIFATANSTRESAGAGYFGIMELSGNLSERVVTIGNAQGRNFIGNNGDGLLSTDVGFEGNANEVGWPGLDDIVTRGVTGAAGSGLRGGAWDDALSGVRLRISDRQNAANAITAALNNAGGRGARTLD